MKISQAKDTTSTYLITLENETGQTLTYTGSESLSAKVWPGDDRPTVATPAVTWVTAPNKIQLVIASSDLTSVLPGVYRVRVYVGGTTWAAEAELEVLAAPGTATALPTYCTAEDLRRRYPLIEQLQTSQDRAGFEEQRSLARQWFDDYLCSAYDSPRRNDRLLVGFGGPDGRQQMSIWLAEGRLIITPTIVAANAWYAIHAILMGAAFANRDPKTDFVTLAYRCSDKAFVERSKPVEIDVSPTIDGSSRITIAAGGTQGVLA